MTTLPPALLDTDIPSAVMRKNLLATEQARSYPEVHRQLIFSVITRHEVLRGLLAKGASTQPAASDKLSAAKRVLPLTDSKIVPAAAIYADFHRRGELLSDADILIAAVPELSRSAIRG